jgi:cystathionine beta-lyase/cystathionine gamma-synthase
VNQRPLELDADIVVHSTTKYLNGHSDVVGGAVVAKEPKVVEKLQYLCNAMGQGASPFDCWLVLRGIKTLVPRMRLHEENKSCGRISLQPPSRQTGLLPWLTTTHITDCLQTATGFGGWCP